MVPGPMAAFYHCVSRRYLIGHGVVRDLSIRPDSVGDRGGANTPALSC